MSATPLTLLSIAATSGKCPFPTISHVQLAASGCSQTFFTPSRRTRASRTADHQPVRPYGQLVCTPTVKNSTDAPAEVQKKAANKPAMSVDVFMRERTAPRRLVVNRMSQRLDKE
jgi:hypothetical protein